MATVDARAARERKQKIFVVVGGLLLVGILAIQLPKLLGGSDSSSAATTTETTAVPGAPTSGTPGTPGTPSGSVPVSAVLTDTDRPLALGPGQLRSFSVFTRKDPFVQQIVSPPESGDTGGEGGGGAAGGGEKSPEKTSSKGFTVGGTATAAVTVISVNGARQTLAPGAAFPAADPVFVLVAEQPDAKSAVIGVAGGAYASGDRTTKLRVGKPLVLVNTTTGARYRLVLVAVGNGGASTPAGPAQDSPANPASP